MALPKRPGQPAPLTALAARLPWWLGLALAAISYLGLHHLAQQSAPAALQPGQMGAFLSTALAWALASVGQYLLPVLFCLGALLSVVSQFRATRLHAAAQETGGIARMSWQDFEILVGEYFRRQGFQVTDNGGGGADGGVDVVLRKGRKSYLVQCKHWRVLRVGVQPVRELYGVMAAQGAAGGFVVTSGDFTAEAVEFAEGLAVTLVNGQTLRHGLQKQGGNAAACDLSAPDCPACGAPMVLRQARGGSTPGKQFWGCSRYAQGHCRATRQID